MLRFQFLMEVDKVLGIIYRSTHNSLMAFDPEIVELIKPLLTTIFVESEEPIDEDASLLFENLLQKVGKGFALRMAQSDFVERHQITRLQRLFDIRMILQEYYARERRAISFIQLWNKLKRKCDFELNQALLVRRLHQMGFQLIDSHGRETVHEVPECRLARLKYLRAMRKHRKDGRLLLYFREATVNNMCWNSTESDPCRADVTKTIVVYFAATETTGLLDFRFARKGQQTIESYVEWLKSVVSTQPANALILLDPKWYDDIAPTIDETTDDDDDTQIEDQMEKIVAAMSGHEILFLPPNHSELNPLHGIDFEHIISGKSPEHNVNESGDNITEERMEIGVRDRLTATDGVEWKQFFDDVRKNEENFLQFEAFLDDDAICVDELDDSGESDVEIVEDSAADNVIDLSDSEIIVLQ